MLKKVSQRKRYYRASNMREEINSQSSNEDTEQSEIVSGSVTSEKLAGILHTSFAANRCAQLSFSSNI